MRRTLAVALGLLLMVGCGPKDGKSTVSGSITYKGQALNGASLHLYPVAGGEEIPIPVGQDGTFRTSDVPQGDYKIVITGAIGNPGPSTRGMTPEQKEKMKDQLEKMKQDPTIPFPNKYKKKETTPLTQTVSKGETKWPLELTD